MLAAVLAALAALVACAPPAQEALSPTSDLPYASEVIDFGPGPGAGYGQDRLPNVVLGPPQGKGTAAGSADVLSLGAGGEIVLGFAPRLATDGPGPDLVVFENAFWAGGDPTQPFAEPAEVAVSADGETWHAFPCDPEGDGAHAWPGCAGWRPTLAYDPEELLPLDPEATGGDPFDLADLGLEEARYVRIRDLSAAEGAASPSAGFDLDAVGLISFAPDPPTQG